MPDEVLPVGAYSELVTEQLELLLSDPDLESRALVTQLRSADSADRYGRHAGSLIARLVGSVNDASRAADGASMLGRLVELLAELVPGSGVSGDGIAVPPRLLEAVRARRPDGELASLELPLTPLLDTTVLTNARGEPAIQHELARRDPVGDRDRRRDGVRPVERCATAADGAAATL